MSTVDLNEKQIEALRKVKKILDERPDIDMAKTKFNSYAYRANNGNRDPFISACARACKLLKSRSNENLVFNLLRLSYYDKPHEVEDEINKIFNDFNKRYGFFDGPFADFEKYAFRHKPRHIDRCLFEEAFKRIKTEKVYLKNLAVGYCEDDKENLWLWAC